MKLGTTELILIMVVALVVFGPSKLPELGKLAGQAVGSFKKYVNSFEGEWRGRGTGKDGAGGEKNGGNTGRDDGRDRLTDEK